MVFSHPSFVTNYQEILAFSQRINRPYQQIDFYHLNVNEPFLANLKQWYIAHLMFHNPIPNQLMEYKLYMYHF